MIQQVEGIPVRLQRLIFSERDKQDSLLFRERTMEDSHTLADYNIKDNSTLKLLLRLLSCAKCPGNHQR
jgi:hypothetical protein